MFISIVCLIAFGISLFLSGGGSNIINNSNDVINKTDKNNKEDKNESNENTENPEDSTSQKEIARFNQDIVRVIEDFDPVESNYPIVTYEAGFGDAFLEYEDADGTMYKHMTMINPDGVVMGFRDINESMVLFPTEDSNKNDNKIKLTIRVIITIEGLLILVLLKLKLSIHHHISSLLK